MPSYLVESYLSRKRATELATMTSRARRVAEAMCGEGSPVRHVRATFLAENEVCLHLFEAPTAEQPEKRADARLSPTPDRGGGRVTCLGHPHSPPSHGSSDLTKQ